MRVIDTAFLDMPWDSSRQMVRHLRRRGHNGHNVGRRRVGRLMMKMGLAPVCQRPRTSDRHPQHRLYPSLLRGLEIPRPNQVWCADVTYIPVRRGFLSLVAIMDWATRKALAWRLSNTMPASACRRWRRRWHATANSASMRIRRARSPACLHDRAEGRRHPDRHGWARKVEGQRLHRAALAVAEVRVRLPPRLRDRLGPARRAHPMDRLLQRPSAILGACRLHPK